MSMFFLPLRIQIVDASVLLMRQADLCPLQTVVFVLKNCCRSGCCIRSEWRGSGCFRDKAQSLFFRISILIPIQCLDIICQTLTKSHGVGWIGVDETSIVGVAYYG